MVQRPHSALWRIPEDLSVIGFDGIQLGTMVEPSLATIETEPRAMRGSAAAAALVLAKVNGTAPPDLTDPTFSYRFRPGGSLAMRTKKPNDDGKTVACPHQTDQ